jgi:hypothetical protein
MYLTLSMSMALPKCVEKVKSAHDSGEWAHFSSTAKNETSTTIRPFLVYSMSSKNTLGSLPGVKVAE